MVIFNKQVLIIGISLFLCVFGVKIGAQSDAFSKEYNFFDESYEDRILDVELYNDSLYFLISHYCPDDKGPCLGLGIADKQGIVSKTISFPWLYSGTIDDLIIRNDTIIVSGHEVAPDSSAFYLLKTNLRGDSIFFGSYNIRGNSYAYNMGLTQSNDHYILCGDTRETEDDLIIGVVVWVKRNGELDTVMYFDKYEEVVATRVDQNGLVTILYERFDSIRLFMHRGFLRFDSQKNIVWQWETEPRNPSRIYKNFTILNDNSICMIERTKEDLHSCAIWKISNTGELLWVYDFNPNGYLKEPFIYEIKQAKNGDLLACGDHFDIYENNDQYLGGYVCRLSLDGKLLWERYFTEIDSTTGPHTAIFNGIEEREDGKMYACGYMGPFQGKNNSWLMLLDENGCYRDSCSKKVFVSTTNRTTYQKDCGISIVHSPNDAYLRFNTDENLIVNGNAIHYTIYSLSGSYIQSDVSREFEEIDISHLNQGMYVIVFDINDMRTYCAQKFVKM